MKLSKWVLASTKQKKKNNKKQTNPPAQPCLLENLSELLTFHKKDTEHTGTRASLIPLSNDHITFACIHRTAYGETSP